MKVAITLDIDWASDACLEYAFETIAAFKIPITVFLTGKSNFINQLAKANGWELEPHPNYLPHSDHGLSQDEVTAHVRKFVFHTYGLRMHRYFVPNNFTIDAFLPWITYTSNDVSHLTAKNPFINKWGIIEIPIFFEDGLYSLKNESFSVEDIMKQIDNDHYYVFNFHPIHIALNTREYAVSRKLKDTLPRREYNTLDKERLLAMRYDGYGMHNLLIDLLTHLKADGCKFYLMKTIANETKV